MSRQYSAVDEQSSYDLSVQLFGTLNELDKVLRQIPDINGVTDFGEAMTFGDSDNNLASRFGANDTIIASGITSEIAPIFPIFDDTFDLTFS